MCLFAAQSVSAALGHQAPACFSAPATRGLRLTRVATRRHLIAAALVVLLLALALCSRSDWPTDPGEASAPFDPEALPESLAIDWLEPPYHSNASTITSLEDIVRLEDDRVAALNEKYPDPVTLGTHLRDLRFRKRPDHEEQVLIEALNQASDGSELDLEQISRIASTITRGVFGQNLLHSLAQTLNRLSYANGRSAWSAELSVLRAIGHVYCRESAVILMRHIPDRVHEMEPIEVYLRGYGALSGLESLPPILSIPCLEAVFRRWFPSGSPTNTDIARELYMLLLRAIDEEYREKYGDPPGLTPGIGISYEWPSATWRYGLGGRQLPRSPLEERIDYRIIL